MNRVVIAAICCLGLLVSGLGYLAHTNPNHNWKGCGWLTYRVRIPPPGKSVEAVGEEQAIQHAIASMPRLYINGKEVIRVAPGPISHHPGPVGPKYWEPINAQMAKLLATREPAHISKSE